MSTIIKQIDTNLEKYYKVHGVNNYRDDKGQGKFQLWADETGMESDAIFEEIETDDANDSIFTDIDDDFPLENNTNREQQIFDIIKKCLKNEFFDIEEKTVMEQKQNSAVISQILSLEKQILSLQKQKLFLQTKIKKCAQMPQIVLSNCLVLSICIQDYKSGSPRIGNEDDIANIDNTFGKNGYGWNIIKNEKAFVSKSDFNIKMNNAKKELLRNLSYDGFLFFISAYGEHFPSSYDDSAIRLSDETDISVSSILRTFHNNANGLGKHFLGKPKIFIFEACRTYPKKPKKDVELQNEYKCDYGYTCDEDIVLIQSSTNGHTSGRNEQTGSYLITEITKAFRQNNQLISFNDVLHETRYNVKCDSKSKQMVQTTSTCIPEVFFNATDKMFMKPSAKNVNEPNAEETDEETTYKIELYDHRIQTFSGTASIKVVNSKLKLGHPFNMNFAKSKKHGGPQDGTSNGNYLDNFVTYYVINYLDDGSGSIQVIELNSAQKDTIKKLFNSW